LNHVLLTSEQFKIRSFSRVRHSRRSTTMAASCYLCLVAVSSRRRRLQSCTAVSRSLFHWPNWSFKQIVAA